VTKPQQTFTAALISAREKVAEQGRDVVGSVSAAVWGRQCGLDLRGHPRMIEDLKRMLSR
jgi:hypothetical protein